MSEGAGTRIRAAVEEAARAACAEGDYDGAATIVIRGYGPEILGFLVGRMHDQTAADDIFSVFCEKVWKGMVGFAWRSSARVWCYTIARNAANTYGRLVVKPAQRKVALSDVGALSALVDAVRTNTAPYLQTGVKTRAQQLREKLSEEDRTILILRVDKGLSWDELAVVFHEGKELPNVKREAARLRKRFQLAKDRLRKLAIEDGLLAKD